MAYTLDDVRTRHPELTEAQARDVVDMLNAEGQTAVEIWASEMGEAGQAIGPDGLTEQQRKANRWADENALAQPFPEKQRTP